MAIREALLNITEAERRWSFHRHFILINEGKQESKDKRQQLTCGAVELLVLNLLQTRETNQHQEPVSPNKTQHEDKTELRVYLILYQEVLPSEPLEVFYCETSAGSVEYTLQQLKDKKKRAEVIWF